MSSLLLVFRCSDLRYRYGKNKMIEDSSSIFLVIRMHYLLSARACRE